MLTAVLLLCAVGTLQSVPLQEAVEKCGYESCTVEKEGFLNVHIVPHTHDDVGWLKTVDQYYYGSRNNIQKAGVQYILDSVVKELWEDPKRRFTYVETAFFWKWWVRQPPATQQRVHALVAQGRLQFAGGAWSMNDEATVNYQTTVDQFTWGLRKLNDTFGQCGRPRVAWQIDPFGHSREFASLLAAMGYDALFLGRVDFQDKAARVEKRNLGFIWRGDDALGEPSDIFTAILYNTYSPPPGFCFDVLCNDEPIVDDPDSPLFNVEARITDFIEYVQKMADAYRTGKLLMTMGGDFTYQDATMWYTNLDKLIEYTNMKAAKEGLNITLLYSTPTCYLKAVKDFNPTIPTKQDDFFPYASDPNAYWTGYFTSRPTIKFFERQGNNFLQALKQLQVLADLQKHNQFVLDELKSAMGIMQHHDAITGTEKQHVNSDYERILTQAVDDALIVANQAFNKIQNRVENPPVLQYSWCRLNESSCPISEEKGQFVVTVYNPLGFSLSGVAVSIPVVGTGYTVFGPTGKKQIIQLYEIPEAVINIPTRVSQATHEIVFLTDLQPLSTKSFYITRLPSRHSRGVTEKRHYDYYSHDNDHWKVPFVDIGRLDDVSLPNLGYKAFNDGFLKYVRGDGKFLTGLEKRVPSHRPRTEVFPDMNDDEMRMLSDDPMVVQRYDDDEGKVFLLGIGNKHHNVRIPDANTIKLEGLPPYTIDFGFYNGTAGKNQDTKDRASGAYIFRPTTTYPSILSDGCVSKNVEGVIFDEVQRECPGVFHSIRLYNNIVNKRVEINWVVGPISVEDGVGKEYIMRIGSNMITNGAVYTDSNGRQVLKRLLNQRPQYNATILEPVAGNYYPVSSHMYLQSDNDPNRLVVIPDRPEGGASLSEGQMELMLHRRLLYDDAFGVDEALNETAGGEGLVVRGSHDLLLHPTGRKDLRNSVLQRQLKPLVLFADATQLPLDTWKDLSNEFTFMQNPMPYGLHLLTLEPWDEKLLIRVENYMDSGHEDLEVDLNELFKNIKLKEFKETLLGANQWMKDFEKLKWNTETRFLKDFNRSYGSFGPVEKVDAVETVDGKVESDIIGTKIKLKSQQIRTFIADYEIV